MSLNDNCQNQQNLQIATSNDDDDDDVSKLPSHQHVSNDISEEPEVPLWSEDALV